MWDLDTHALALWHMHSESLFTAHVMLPKEVDPNIPCHDCRSAHDDIKYIPMLDRGSSQSDPGTPKAAGEMFLFW